MGSLFAYGSLVFPAVLEAVTGLVRRPQAARLADHARFLVRGQSYPAVVSAIGESTEGVVYDDLTPQAFDRLDRFEGSFYERLALEVDRGGRPRRAFVYRATDEARALVSDVPFDLDAFERDHLATWLANLRRR